MTLTSRVESDQRRAALERANFARIGAAQVKRDLRDLRRRELGLEFAAERIERADPRIDHLTVHTLLAAIPTFGEIRARKFFRATGLPAAAGNRRLDRLTAAEAELLVRSLRRRAEVERG